MAGIRTSGWQDREVAGFLSSAQLAGVLVNFGMQYKVDLASNHEELPTSCCCVNGELTLPDGVSNISAKGYSLAEVDVDEMKQGKYQVGAMPGVSWASWGPQEAMLASTRCLINSC